MAERQFWMTLEDPTRLTSVPVWVLARLAEMSTKVAVEVASRGGYKASEQDAKDFILLIKAMLELKRRIELAPRLQANVAPRLQANVVKRPREKKEGDGKDKKVKPSPKKKKTEENGEKKPAKKKKKADADGEEKKDKKKKSKQPVPAEPDGPAWASESVADRDWNWEDES